MNQRQILSLVAILGILAWTGKIPLPDDWKPNPTPTPVVPVDPSTPTLLLQQAVKPVKDLLAGHADAPKFAAFSEAFANLIEAPQFSQKTNAELRAAWGSGLNLCFRGKGGPVGLATAVDAVLGSQLGMEPDKPIDRPKAADTFRALAWAARGGNA